MENLEREIGEFREAFCPYGYLDIKMAVENALSAGHDSGWAYEQVEAFADECCMKISDIDPCYVVMDSIMQEARNEIEGLTGFDLQNDAGFEVYGNYMCTCYDWRDEDIEGLKQALKENEVTSDDLSDATMHWLGMIDVNIEEL
ncbi:hypothetical protein SRABI27_03704 [Pedobacter sp. Bi27]|uniref:hypothetical protein n=1 Tax=Pedobacter sp. Bi27 TaxID=2822351 RepID=UPI001D1F46C0|nr:hypothetical protein [Pedobacter sp. Bi27]CAH0278497.1 hypothetical protein SRABI27_03704 [Pedobacter sp. Bi27]